MVTVHCAAVTRDGMPCRAYPRPGRRFCPFHDPACAGSLLAGRRKGGAAPHREVRPRFDAARAKDTLCRLIMTELASLHNLETERLQALASLAPTLLKLTDRLPSPPRRSTLPPGPPAAGK
jgi:hypothetical protein